MQTQTVGSTKRAPARKVSKKPLSKAKVTAVPKPMSKGRGAARTLYKFNGEMPEQKGFTPQMYALIQTANEAKKKELDSSSFTAQDLVALAVKNGTLTTGQDPLRIFRFYAKRLVEEGYFSKV
jgi:hypothetical protein|tara:strand:+ start:472 stop:840 length:369 start_codon:yes stop_codon:yes gene_type:complete